MFFLFFCHLNELEDDSKRACDKEMLWQKAWHTCSGFIPSCALFSVNDTFNWCSDWGLMCRIVRWVWKDWGTEKEREVLLLFFLCMKNETESISTILSLSQSALWTAIHLSASRPLYLSLLSHLYTSHLALLSSSSTWIQFAETLPKQLGPCNSSSSAQITEHHVTHRHCLIINVTFSFVIALANLLQM